MHVENNIVFTERQSDRLALDLYLPSRKTKALIVYAYGGGFTRGTRCSDFISQLAKRITGEGYALAAIDYRLNAAPESIEKEQQKIISQNMERGLGAGVSLARRLMGFRCEAARQDIGEALALLKRNRRQWGIHNERIGLIGTSAGGIAGMALAYAPRHLPNLPSPDAVFVLGGAMIHPWRLRSDGPRCVFLHSTLDRIIAPKNLHLVKKRAEQTGAPIEVLFCGRKGHNAPNQALFEDSDETGASYWGHMIALFETELNPSPANV
ncbi:alpha/beta hydrolase [Shimia sp. CNT1-13L.2]|uniref:alpha/beta hydrolase n=1 Tax=Shimia sp. CNT1-13L.2 TaxID=2959663 RepID=UPI0020CB8099|nr:alpha/beta hydrolase [Shimia sp. CNT1-13L.2]MCP9482097.1 alpha/beta hydrolase [Shimia sp. CNT1-13L.2]